MTNLGPIEPTRCTGNENFHDKNKSLKFDLLSFWQWSESDIVSNATRGILAEYLVAQALGIADGNVREEWAAYDLETKEGIKVEVKSAAYIQSWQQRQFSKISFRVPKTFGWTKEENLQSKESKRQAEVYVFALLAHMDQATLDPLDISQWEFFILPTTILNKRERSQYSITLSSLKKLTSAIKYSELKQAVEKAYLQQMESSEK